VTRQIDDRFRLGTEIFQETAELRGEKATIGVNMGAFYDSTAASTWSVGGTRNRRSRWRHAAFLLSRPGVDDMSCAGRKFSLWNNNNTWRKTARHAGAQT
jgi:hypothetical protein